jgi:SH3-like domain-containing protein
VARGQGGSLGWLLVLILVGAGGNLLSHYTPSSAPTAEADHSPQSPFYTSPSSPAASANFSESRTHRSKVLYVTASTLNIRAAPSPTATVLLAAPRGTPVASVSTQDGWYEVKLTNGATGWMNGAYLSESPPAAPSSSVQPVAPIERQVDRATIVQALIRESLASYPGNCPCPYNTDRAGRSCGRRSGWSKGGGYSPLCYPTDVTDGMINEYLSRQR